jgi:hypothetical protein
MEKFFEESPLYTKLYLSKTELADEEPYKGWISSRNGTPSITLFCTQCSKNTTFVKSQVEDKKFTSGREVILRGANDVSSVNRSYLHIVYQCQNCQEFNTLFVVYFGENDKGFYIKKVGQDPPLSIQPPSDVSDFLNERQLKLYSKGLSCESQGYGMAAYSYFRRIVEETIDKLINGLKKLAEEDGDEELIKQIDKALAMKNASEKIDLLKEYIPTSLKPGGQNSFGLLYGQLSEGIHSLDESECLERASAIKAMMNFLIKRINSENAENAVFIKSVKKLNSQKNKKQSA